MVVMAGCVAVVLAIGALGCCGVTGETGLVDGGEVGTLGAAVVELGVGGVCGLLAAWVTVMGAVV